MNIAEVIGWKFNHQPGMRCKEINGKLEIIEFPGGIPSQQDQDLWASEYQAYLASGEPEAKQAQEEISPVLDILVDQFIQVVTQVSTALQNGQPVTIPNKNALIAAIRAARVQELRR